ncbi:MAG: hypothetical protein HQL19_01510 [Candidatus Omnitrophica bacterium]|nr:hypothetical protein [Candidatus Omnitrophota bacterium]
MKKFISVFVLLVFAVGMFLVGAAPAQANIKMMKAYKEAYPDAKIKCISCHVVAMPKKDDGQHDMNDYGKAVVDAAAKDNADKVPTADTFKKVGTIEQFKK